MNKHRLVRPRIVPEAGPAPAWESQRLDPGRSDVAELKVAIVGRERDRKPAVAAMDAAHCAASIAKVIGPV